MKIKCGQGGPDQPGPVKGTGGVDLRMWTSSTSAGLLVRGRPEGVETLLVPEWFSGGRTPLHHTQR